MLVPNSSAMDATATSGGPITFLSEIVTGDPDTILAQVSALVHKAAQFAQIVGEFEQARQQLDKAWSGGAAESALKKITDSLSAFEKIIKVTEEGAALLGVSSGLVRAAQAAYTAVVSAVNPVVAALMSNPWTEAAAVALSTAASALLRGFIWVIRGLLQVLGAVKIAMQVMELVQVIQDIEQLASQGSHGPGGVPQGHPPVIAPPPPSSVGSNNGGDTSFTMPPIPNQVPTQWNGGSHGGGSDSGAGWVPVDHGSSGTVAAGGGTTGGTSTHAPSGHDVGVTVGSDGSVSVNVHDHAPTPAAPGTYHGTPASHTPVPPRIPPVPVSTPGAVPSGSHGQHSSNDDTFVTLTHDGTTTTVELTPGEELTIEIDGDHVTEHVSAHR